MKLRFRNTIGDLVAFSRYFHERSPALKAGARATGFWVFLAVVAMFFLIVLPVLQHGWPDWLRFLAWLFAFTVATIAGLLVYFLWKPYMLRKIGQAVRRMQERDPDKVAFAERELELTRHELVERNEYGEFRWKLSAVEEIVDTPTHVFVKLSAMRSYILPREALDRDELEMFLQELEQAHALPPPIPPPEPSPPSPQVPAPPRDAIREKW